MDAADNINGKEKARARLDVEDEEARTKRIQSILERMSGPLVGNSRSAQMSPFLPEKIPRSPERPTTLLARIRDFLPQIEESNAALTRKMTVDPKSVDIENVSEDQVQIIEMHLGLGVFTDRSQRAKQHRHSSCSSHDTDSDETLSSDDDESSSSEDSDTSTSHTVTLTRPTRPIRPLPKRSRRPAIEILEECPDPRVLDMPEV